MSFTQQTDILNVMNMYKCRVRQYFLVIGTLTPNLVKSSPQKAPKQKQPNHEPPVKKPFVANAQKQFAHQSFFPANKDF